MSNSNEFTHILDIKVIHQSDGNIVNNKELLRQVKENLTKINNSQLISWNGKEEEIFVLWKKKKWPFPYNKFIGGLIFNSPYNVDTIVQQHTAMTIEEVVGELRQNYRYWRDFNVVFHITKPMSVTTPLPGCVGFEEA